MHKKESDPEVIKEGGNGFPGAVDLKMADWGHGLGFRGGAAVRKW